VVTWETFGELMKPSGVTFLARGCSTLVRQSDNLIIGIFLDAKAVLVYALTKRAFEALWMILTQVVGSFAPALAHFFGELQGETAKARSMADTLIHVVVVLSFILMGGYILLDGAFVALWVGGSFFAGNLVTILIGIFGILAGTTLAFSQVVFSRGRIHTVALAAGVEALLYLPLVLVLIRWLGMPGVALAGVMAVATTGWWILGYRFLVEFNISWQDSLRIFKPPFLVGAGILMIGLVLHQFGQPATVLAFGLQGFGYLAATSVWVLLMDGRIRGLVADIRHGRSLKI
jgi:O-antigen/teichoic acid export membrane protein